MRRLNLQDYIAYSKTPDQACPGKFLDIQYPYPVKDAILTVMFAPVQRLSGAELIKQQAVALKIEASKNGEIMLEEAEYERVKNAFAKFEGFGRIDIELVTRINEAEIVEVEPKK